MRLVQFDHTTLNVDQVVRVDADMKKLSDELALADIYGISLEVYTTDGKVLVMETYNDLKMWGKILSDDKFLNAAHPDVPYMIHRYLEYVDIRDRNLKAKNG